MFIFTKCIFAKCTRLLHLLTNKQTTAPIIIWWGVPTTHALVEHLFLFNCFLVTSLIFNRTCFKISGDNFNVQDFWWQFQCSRFLVTISMFKFSGDNPGGIYTRPRQQSLFTPGRGNTQLWYSANPLERFYKCHLRVKNEFLGPRGPLGIPHSKELQDIPCGDNFQEPLTATLGLETKSDWKHFQTLWHWPWLNQYHLLARLCQSVDQKSSKLWCCYAVLSHSSTQPNPTWGSFSLLLALLKYKIVSSSENVGGYKKRYFSPTVEEQGMLLAMGKRAEEQSFEGDGSSPFELIKKTSLIPWSSSHGWIDSTCFRCWNSTQ